MVLSRLLEVISRRIVEVTLIRGMNLLRVCRRRLALFTIGVDDKMLVYRGQRPRVESPYPHFLFHVKKSEEL